MGLKELIDAMGQGTEPKTIPVKDVLEEAKKQVRQYNDKEYFVSGDLVTWKEGMKNKKYPDYGEPVVVLEIFPAVRSADGHDAYSCEPIDMRCIVLKEAESGQFVTFTYDSSRFTTYRG